MRETCLTEKGILKRLVKYELEKALFIYVSFISRVLILFPIPLYSLAISAATSNKTKFKRRKEKNFKKGKSLNLMETVV